MITKKKSVFRYLVAALILVIVGWTGLTIYVETKGPSKQWTFESATAKKTALVVFDADPFYNLDEQVCISLGKALAEGHVRTHVATVAAAERLKSKDYDIVVYCANTYNWRPDWAVSDFIESNKNSFQNTAAVGITLGAGSTEASQEHLEKLINNGGGKLIGSYSLWLWRPNDEKNMEEPNVEVAVAKAHDWAKQIVERTAQNKEIL